MVVTDLGLAVDQRADQSGWGRWRWQMHPVEDVKLTKITKRPKRLTKVSDILPDCQKEEQSSTQFNTDSDVVVDTAEVAISTCHDLTTNHGLTTNNHLQLKL